MRLATSHAPLEKDQYRSSATKRFHSHEDEVRGDDPGVTAQ
jgi:hypothetical protein